MQTLKNYLEEQHSPATAKAYHREILLYKERVPKAEKGTYKTVINYLDYLRKQHIKSASINRILASIKSYYYYLVANGKRNDHPCKHLYLRDNKTRDIQLQDLFSPEELELLMERKARYANLDLKYKLIISLLIYQGLTSAEIVKITLDDVNLELGEIHIKPSLKLNERTLKLRQNQVLIFYRYINEYRPKLLKHPTDILIIGKLGNHTTVCGIGYVLDTFKTLFPERKLTTITVRQSVIANKLKQGMDLRLVQHFAGHKYPSTTERYKQSQIDELQQGVNQYHPLG